MLGPNLRQTLSLKHPLRQTLTLPQKAEGQTNRYVQEDERKRWVKVENKKMRLFNSQEAKTPSFKGNVPFYNRV
jgi:hypothetical protein